MKYRFRLVVTLVLVSVGITVAATPAVGDPPNAPPGPTSGVTIQPQGLSGSALAQANFSCPSQWVCFWVNSNENGDRGAFYNNQDNWFNWYEPQCYPPAAKSDSHGTWADCASSDFNNGVYDEAVFHDQTGNIGNGLVICRGTGGNLWTVGWDNRPRSNAWYSGC